MKKLILLLIINVISSSRADESSKIIHEGPSARTQITPDNSVIESVAQGAKILQEPTSSSISSPDASSTFATTPATAIDPHKGAKELHVPKTLEIPQDYPPSIETDEVISHTPVVENRAIPLTSNSIPHLPVLQTKPVMTGYMEHPQESEAYPIITPVVKEIARGTNDTKILSILAPIMAKDRPVKKAKPNRFAGYPDVQARAIETELTHVLTDQYLNHALIPIVVYHPVPCIETEKNGERNDPVVKRGR